MKKLALILLAVVVLLCGCKVAKPKVFKLAETHPQGYPTELADEEFAKLVEAKTKGAIKIEVYHSKQLGEEKAVLEQVQFGAIEFTRVSLAPVASFYSKLNVLQMPYLYRDSDHMWKVLNGPIGEGLLKEIESAKLIGLCYFDGGTRNFYNRKKEVKSVTDLKGMKIRVQETPIMVGMIKALGATPYPMPYGEVFSALQTGVVDAAENNWPSYDSASHYQVAKYYSTDEHLKIPEILVASLITWNKLSKKEQEIIRQSAKEAVPVQIKLWTEKEKASEAKVRAAGCIITEIKDKSEFQKAMAPVYDQLPADQRDLVKQIQEVK
jgi:tripartite ATP-independent transporter DctP family solute receptor